ncbi:MAG: hypothetical protein M3O29_03795 [Actinomycetota bacterium]|nr:hypothetical protein [Actinomycetota bacterium]
MFGVIFLVALGILVGELLRGARQRRGIEAAWRREDEEFLRHLRKSR